MADQDDGSGKACDQFLQQFQRLHVEIVGRFVEHEQIGRTGKHARQDQPGALAARELAHRRARLFGFEQEVLHVGDDVALLAVDDEVLAAPVGQVAGQRLVRIDRFTLLVEGCDLEIDAKPHSARIRVKLAGQHLEQCRLAGAVRPDKADAVAALDACREALDHGQVAEALFDVLGLDDQLAGFGSIARHHRRHALGAAMAAEFLAHRLKLA